MKKEMFINAQRDECRIAIVSEGVLSELYTERASAASQVGNVYKGRVTNVEPSIQAAFVDFGKAKNGFLHISDLNPTYFPEGQNQVEIIGKKRARRDRPPIQLCLRRGQEVLVQVTKEGIGTKGATLTTYVSIPGRYLVLMPGMHRLGVSRKIEDEQARTHLREILQELKPPAELGFIVRTAGVDRPKRDLQRDLAYLVRLWKAVEQRASQAHAPAELYQESDLVIRTIRDIYNTEIERIVCDNEAVACKVKEFLQLTMPRSTNRVEYYDGAIGLFHAFGLEEEIEKINSARVPLPLGGSLVIDQAEALVAIDVNSGRFRQTDNAEQTALRINLEAAREVARQLRLRDLGGVIVIDFIDMTEERHRRQVEKALRDEVANDRARTKLLRISRLGIVEMTRQRVRPSLTSSIFRTCPHCAGLGHVKSEESQALSVMRTLSLAASDERVSFVEMSVSPPVADYLLNRRRDELVALEQATAAKIVIHGEISLPGSELRIACSDARGSVLQWDSDAAAQAGPKQVQTRLIDLEDLRQFRSQQASDLPVTPDATDILPATQEEAAYLQELEEEPAEPAEAAPAEGGLPSQPAQPPQPAPARPTARPAAGTGPLPAQPGTPGEPGLGHRRRRRRHRGRGHRGHGQGAPGQIGPDGQPIPSAQPVAGGPAAVPAPPAPAPARAQPAAAQRIQSPGQPHFHRPASPAPAAAHAAQEPAKAPAITGPAKTDRQAAPPEPAQAPVVQPQPAEPSGTAEAAASPDQATAQPAQEKPKRPPRRRFFRRRKSEKKPSAPAGPAEGGA
jgi:ribonuclease E